jgi:iron-sulfur cluster assembly protein
MSFQSLNNISRPRLVRQLLFRNRKLQTTSEQPSAAPINYKIGNERLIKVTETASRKLMSLLEKQGRATGALRVAVIGGGCSGLQYKMDLVDGPANRDIMVETSNVRVVVDPKSALFVSGSLLDFSEDLQKGGFKVTNPNAVAHCSCGESFAA